MQKSGMLSVWQKMQAINKYQDLSGSCTSTPKKEVAAVDPLRLTPLIKRNDQAVGFVDDRPLNGTRPASSEPFLNRLEKQQRDSVDNFFKMTPGEQVDGNSAVEINGRNLAQLEYDWLAAVIERVFLIIFLCGFFLAAIGINAIGFYYWSMASNIAVV